MALNPVNTNSILSSYNPPVITQPEFTYRDFCYWLQGFFEIANPDTLTTQQIEVIKEHLLLCFNKVTTSQITSMTIKSSYPDLQSAFSVVPVGPQGSC